MSEANPNYKCHDYEMLIRRWKKICKLSNLNFHEVENMDGYPCYEICSSLTDTQNINYISAGIHGDEPASSAGLLRWAENSLSFLQKKSFLIYPCLNPWGLVNNCRFNLNGKDLNRIWDNSENPFIKYIIKRTQNLSFQLVLNLHEDYDGEGIYLYQPSRGGRPDANAKHILESASKFISTDPRKKIDGRKATDGIIRPRPSKPPEDGFPEALHFYLNHKCPTYTIETPSEFDLHLRIEAQKAMIQKALSIY